MNNIIWKTKIEKDIDFLERTYRNLLIALVFNFAATVYLTIEVLK